MQGVDAGVQGIDPGMQGVDALHTASTPGMCTCISMETATLGSVMQAACRASTPRKYTENELATCMQAACMLLQPATSCIRSYAGCMQAACSLHACSLHASLVWHRLYEIKTFLNCTGSYNVRKHKCRFI